MSRNRVNVGGTSGGFGEFLTGLLLMIVGFYMMFTNTIVSTSFWHYQGRNLLGPLIILAMTVGILMHLRLHFQSITLLSALVMFGLPAVGLGLIMRALRAHEAAAVEDTKTGL